MKYPASYIAYLVEFHATRDYFECHELLEEYWKEHPGDGFASSWVGLIQVAVGSYHERRGNRRGALMMFEQALSRLEPDRLRELGLAGAELLTQLRQRTAALKEGQVEAPFADMMLPIADPALMRECEKLCAVRGLVWGVPSSLGDEALVHRHKLRDRSGVIAARAAAAVKKEQARRTR